MIFFSKIPSHILIASSAWASRGVSIAFGLLNIRILTSYLGEDSYALYLLLLNIAGWFALSDLGIGYSLQNFISEAKAKSEEYFPFIINAVFLLFIGALLQILLCCFLYQYLSSHFLQSFKFLDDQLKVNLVLQVLIVSVFTYTSIIAHKIWYAIGKGYIANMFTALTALFSFIFTYLISKYVEDNKIQNVLFAYLIPNFFFTFFPLLFILFKIPRSYFQISFPHCRMIIKRSFDFWVFGILSALVLQIDYLVMAKYVPNNELVLYSVVTKVFNILFFAYTALLGAIWPVFNKLILEGSWDKVFYYIKRYIIWGVLFFVLFTLSFYFYNHFFLQLLSPELTFSLGTTTIILFCVYYILRVWSDTFAVVLQSFNFIKPLWLLVPFQAAISIFFQIKFSQIYGINGVLLGLILSFVLTVVIFLPYFVYQKYKKYLKHE